jgi:nucleotide-binding universal stress UspA family protein
MNTGPSILVGVDGSPAAQRALAWAAQYAADTHQSVLATHVLTYSAEFFRDLPPTGLTAWRTNVRERLEQDWVQPLSDKGVPFRAVVLEADSVDGGLLQAAAENNTTMVVLGAHGHADLKDRLLGGVTYKVSHHADRPVVIVPADWTGRPGSERERP